jgi:GDPmannose 4,6-dehydratase
MLQQDVPDDYVIGTGESHSAGEFVEKAFNYVGIDIEWKGTGVGKKGIIRSLISTLTSTLHVGDTVIKIDPRYFRPTEIEELIADSTKAKKKLNWHPRVTFKDLVKIMVDADMRSIGLNPIGKGDEILRQKFPHKWWEVD